MVKQSTDNWYYERRNPNGELDPALDGGVNVNPCFNCHVGLKSTDCFGATGIKN